MNFRMIGQVIGRVLCIEAALMLLPMVAALAYGETPAPFLITIAVTGGIGLVMWRQIRRYDRTRRFSDRRPVVDRHVAVRRPAVRAHR